MDRNLVCDHLRKTFRERRPSDGDDGVGDRAPHQLDGFAQQEDLNVVTRGREGVRVVERERRLRRIRRSPGALDEDFHFGQPRISAMRAFTIRLTRPAGSGSANGKRSVPFDVS